MPQHTFINHEGLLVTIFRQTQAQEILTKKTTRLSTGHCSPSKFTHFLAKIVIAILVKYIAYPWRNDAKWRNCSFSKYVFSMTLQRHFRFRTANFLLNLIFYMVKNNVVFFIIFLYGIKYYVFFLPYTSIKCKKNIFKSWIAWTEDREYNFKLCHYGYNEFIFFMNHLNAL